jgi:hypothetical protein
MTGQAAALRHFNRELQASNAWLGQAFLLAPSPQLSPLQELMRKGPGQD